MTTPEGDSMQAQMLLKISNDVSGLVTDVAVIKSQMDLLSDHETRIRELRAEMPAKLADRLQALETQQAQVQGGRDAHARVVSWGAVVAALAGGIANFVHH